MRKLAERLHFEGEWQRTVNSSAILSGTIWSTAGRLVKWQTFRY
jgi:hypothetical protein